MRMIYLFCLTLLFTSAAFASEGPKLYKQHCAACHGHQGERKAWNVTSPIAGWGSEAVKEALLGYKQNTRNQYGYGDYMHPQIDKYTIEEIEEISRYVATLTQQNLPIASTKEP